MLWGQKASMIIAEFQFDNRKSELTTARTVSLQGRKAGIIRLVDNELGNEGAAHITV